MEDKNNELLHYITFISDFYAINNLNIELIADTMDFYLKATEAEDAVSLSCTSGRNQMVLNAPNITLSKHRIRRKPS